MATPLLPIYEIFSALPSDDYDECAAFLKGELSWLFADEYRNQFGGAAADILEFEVMGYHYLFDLIGNKESESDDRIVAAYGRVIHTVEARDSSRMKGFIGPFTKIEKYKDYDKGHFVAHKINGSLDHNLYPQLRELNRGWSAQGKLFRAMERYCENNLDAFMFTRPVYQDLSWVPDFIDYGVFTKEFGLLVNRFHNKKATIGDEG